MINKTNMQFKVPQDVQREDTIIGPITLKQLIILGIGGFIAYATYLRLAKLYFMEVWLPPVAIISAITLAFAFLKIHNLPFHIFLMDLIEYKFLPRKRMWAQGTGTPFIPPFEEDRKKIEKKMEQKAQKQNKSLAELTQILDSHGESALSKSERKAKLTEIVEQNYKN